MKFPKPRVLEENTFPDLTLTQPDLFKKMIRDKVFPNLGTKMDIYFDSTIRFLKEKAKEKTQNLKVNYKKLNKKLYFMINSIGNKSFNSLIDTGAANSLIHAKLANRLNLSYEPTKMTLMTATGTSEDAILGIAHTTVDMYTEEEVGIVICVDFIVTTQLNGLDAILGAEFLFNTPELKGLDNEGLNWTVEDRKYRTPIFEEGKLKGRRHEIKDGQKIRIECRECKKQTEQTEQAKATKVKNCSKLFSHSVKETYDEETLPEGESFFDENLEVKFEILDKKFTIEDGDYSQCPHNWQSKVRKLVEEFKDRFSTSKLDLEKTDIMTADLPTLKGRKVQQKCRRLPNHRYEFAVKALTQLQKAGVIRESNSEWKSNVVMIPKPIAKDELRSTTKSDMQSRKDEKSQLYRICLDFRELNSILIFPQQSQFTSIDSLLYTLQGKKVVSMDISSSFFIIPIREEDKHKTSFWCNDREYEFESLVMGLKSSPWWLKKFMEKAFSKESFQECSVILSSAEKALIPDSFEKMMKSYFDDCFVYADTYEQLFIAFKLVLVAARKAKIKFSIEKSTFFCTELKVLGYSFNTENAVLHMDQLKSSAIQNMKKPSSLYELHSRLASFQYQQQFLPYMKHILYPLHFMLRKRVFEWGELEEEAWQLAKHLSILGMRLVIPDPKENLVLTTDASKVAAAACLFREKNGELDLVAVNSKYFAVVDLNKCSYILESIAL
ncbi:MAG: hypothetical protein EHM77_06535, partial [Planctomycetaceae bacterium]